MNFRIWLESTPDISQFSPQLQDDVQHLLDVWEDNDEVNPPQDPNLLLYYILNDILDSDYGKEHQKEIRNWMVKHNVYRPISQQELDQTQTLGRGKKYDFALKGQKYVFDKHPDGYDDWMKNSDKYT